MEVVQSSCMTNVMTSIFVLLNSPLFVLISKIVYISCNLYDAPVLALQIVILQTDVMLNVHVAPVYGNCTLTLYKGSSGEKSSNVNETTNSMFFQLYKRSDGGHATCTCIRVYYFPN